MKKYDAEIRKKAKEMSVQGMKQRDIAAALGIPAGSIHAIINNPTRRRKRRRKTAPPPKNQPSPTVFTKKGQKSAIQAIIASNIPDTDKLVVIDILCGK